MFTVNGCCCCCSLEAGGLILGWITAIVYFFASIIFGLSSIGIFFVSCDELLKNTKGIDLSQYDCGMIKAGFFFGMLIAFIISLILFYFGYLLIVGTKNRSAGKVKPMMILFAICSIMCFLGLLSFRKESIVSSILGGLLNGYFFVVLYSLADMFKMENQRGYNTQYQAPGAKV